MGWGVRRPMGLAEGEAIGGGRGAGSMLQDLQEGQSMRQFLYQ